LNQSELIRKLTRAKDIPEADLPALQQKAVDLLDLLKKNLPDWRKGRMEFREGTQYFTQGPRDSVVG
jgi:hypothetical protein